MWTGVVQMDQENKQGHTQREEGKGGEECEGVSAVVILRYVKGDKDHWGWLHSAMLSFILHPPLTNVQDMN